MYAKTGWSGSMSRRRTTSCAELCKFLREIDCQKEVEGCLRAKKVYVGGKSVGYTFHGVWYWENTAARDMACDASALQPLTDKINAR